jgi:hypothetical protein
MREAVGLPRSAIAVQCEDCALSKKVRRGIVLVQVGEDGSKRLARMQLLRGLRVLGVHVHHEVGILGEKRHLALRITPIGAVRVGLDELPYCDSIAGLRGRDRDLHTHGSLLIHDQCFHR